MDALNPRYTLNSESVWWAEAGDCSWGDLVLVCSKVNTSMASWDPLCRTLDIVSVVNNSLRINFKSRDALHMNAKMPLLFRKTHCEVRGIISSGKEIHSDF